MPLSSAKSTRLIALVTMRITAGTNAWRKVEGVTPSKRNGNVLSLCVTPAYINALDTMSLTEKHQEKVQVCVERVIEKTTW